MYALSKKLIIHKCRLFWLSCLAGQVWGGGGEVVAVVERVVVLVVVVQLVLVGGWLGGDVAGGIRGRRLVHRKVRSSGLLAWTGQRKNINF